MLWIVIIVAVVMLVKWRMDANRVERDSYANQVAEKFGLEAAFVEHIDPAGVLSPGSVRPAVLRFKEAYIARCRTRFSTQHLKAFLHKGTSNLEDVPELAQVVNDIMPTIHVDRTVGPAVIDVEQGGMRRRRRR